MTPKKTDPPKYKSGPSGKHTSPGFVFRAPAAELEAITAAAAAAGVPRNDWLRDAAKTMLDAGGTRPRASWLLAGENKSSRKRLK